MSGYPTRPADFNTRRFCPFHGEFIKLADCKIVATNATMIAAAAAPAIGVSSSQPTLKSSFDGKDRVILGGPPRPPAITPRRFQRAESPRLPSPLEIVGGANARARPARACPVCGHPLPSGIDLRDPISVSLVGHSGASKTTTLVALVELIRRDSPALIDFEEFVPAGGTAQQFREAMGAYREANGQVKQTYKEELHAPMEFFAAPGRYNQPINILFHDVAGEQLTDRDARFEKAPALLWSDLVIFFYNPEESPRLDLLRTGLDQAVLLNGIHDDIVDMTRFKEDQDGSAYLPPLIVLLCKSDLLPPEIAKAASHDEAGVQAAIRGLGDADLVAAGLRWPEVHWCFVSAQPAGGGPPIGVVETFRLASRLLSHRA